jgi:hypothetical protein
VLRDPDQLVVAKVTQRVRRAERDPADLLRLAVPGSVQES